MAAGNGAMSAWTNRTFNFAVDYDQYARLGDALIHGHTNLDLPVPDELAQMSNPYDSDLRGQVAGRIDIPIYWDHAFYKGKYYCYFGVVPAILLFIPYQLLTGKWLSSAYAVLVLGCIASLFATVLAVQVAKKFLNNRASIGMVCLASMILTLGSSMYYQLLLQISMRFPASLHSPSPMPVYHSGSWQKGKSPIKGLHSSRLPLHCP